MKDAQPMDVCENVDHEIPHCFVKRFQGGGSIQVDFEDSDFKSQYVDEYTGEVLKHELIKEAIVEELKYFCEKEVWMIEDMSVMKSLAEHVFVNCRWVLCDEGARYEGQDRCL